MPYVYNAMVVNYLFANMKNLSIYAFAQTIFGYRMYTKHSVQAPAPNGSDLLTMDMTQFSAAVKEFP